MKRVYTDVNKIEADFLAKIGDRELTPEEKKELQRIRRNARQYQWLRGNKFILKSDIPAAYRYKLKCIVAEKGVEICKYLCSVLDEDWKRSSSYKAILELYNFLDLSSDTIDEDLASEKLKLTKVRNYSALVYENKAGIYIDSGFIIPESEIKALD